MEHRYRLRFVVSLCGSDLNYREVRSWFWWETMSVFSTFQLACSSRRHETDGSLRCDSWDPNHMALPQTVTEIDREIHVNESEGSRLTGGQRLRMTDFILEIISQIFTKMITPETEIFQGCLIPSSTLYPWVWSKTVIIWLPISVQWLNNKYHAD